MDFSIVVATDNIGGIGYYDKDKDIYNIPWKNREEMLFFKKLIVCFSCKLFGVAIITASGLFSFIK